MTRPDLEAIRARCGRVARADYPEAEHAARFYRREAKQFVRTDIPALLAYVEELERRCREIGAQVDELREQYDSVLEANVQAMDGRPWRGCK